MGGCANLRPEQQNEDDEQFGRRPWQVPGLRLHYTHTATSHHDDHEGAHCEMIFLFWSRSMHASVRQDSARHGMIVLAWPQTTCGACHDGHVGARYEMSAPGWPRMTNGVRHDGDAAEGWCCAPKICCVAEAQRTQQ